MSVRDVLAEVGHLEATAVRRMTNDGVVQLSWRSWGEGPPLVLLHGGFGSWLHWTRNIGDLAKTFSVHAVDLPGLGDSGPPPENYTGDGLAAAIARGIDLLLGERTPFLLGAFSLGSVIAVPLICQMGWLVRGAVLIGASGLGPMWKNAVADQKRRSSTMSDAETRAVIRENLGSTMIADHRLIDDGLVTIQMGLLNQRRRLIGLPLSQSSIVLDSLHTIKDRAILIWGDHDPYLQPDVATTVGALRAGCPGLDVRIIENTGHWANYEQPRVVSEIFHSLSERVG